MLMQSDVEHDYHEQRDATAFYNFYEHLVMEHIVAVEIDKVDDPVYISDVACVALNHLPPRYVRSTFDLTLYLSPEEQQEIELKVSRAVKDAILLVNKRYSFAQNGPD